MFYPKPDPLPASATPARGGRTTAGEQFLASWRAQRDVDNTDSRARLEFEMLLEIAPEVEKLTGVSIYEEGSERPTMEQRAMGREFHNSPARAVMAAQYRLKQLIDERPDLSDQLRDYQSALSEGVNARMRRVETRDRDLMSRSGAAATAAGFAGRMAGAMTDPINIASLPLGGPGKTVVGTAARAGAAGATTEAVIQPFVQMSRSEAGLDAGFDRAAENVAMAGLGGFALGGALDGLARLPGVVRSRADARQLRLDRSAWAAWEMMGMLDDAPPQSGRDALLAAFDEANPAARGVMREYRDAVELDLERDRANPFAPGLRANADYRAVITNFESDMRIEAIEIPDHKITAKAGEAAAQNFAGYELVDPRRIKVDAKRFQFKSGGDQYGVTDRLAGVTKWDPVKAKPLILWEDAAGQRFVADGHQRTGLATRLMNEQGIRIEMAARVLKESDGITADEARAIAAGVNLAEGTGTVVDAAKVLRVNPDLLDGSIPMTSTRMRQANALTRLSDEAFMLVVNEIVPENFAAVVGRLAGDQPDLQADLMGLLARVEPENEFQAESVIAQALAGPVRREVQDTLFGEEMITRSLYGERAKVLDGSLRRLKRDQALFNRLIENESRITTQGGNQLDRAANQQKVQTDAQTQDLLNRLANRSGPISDALNAAAERLADGRTLGSVVTEFTDIVRAEISGGLGGRGGDRLRPSEAQSGDAGASVTARAGDDLDGFDQPGAARPDGEGAEPPLTARELDDKTFDMFGEVAAGVPVRDAIDEGGDRAAALTTREEMQAEIDQDTAMLERLRGCAYE